MACRPFTVCIYTTKASLGGFLEAVREVSRETGGAVRMGMLLYAGEADEEKVVEFISRLGDCDVLLMDVRSLDPSTRLLLEACRGFKGLVVPVVGAGPEVLRLARLGRLDASKIPMKERGGFDSASVEVASAAKAIALMEAVGRIVPVGPAVTRGTGRG